MPVYNIEGLDRLLLLEELFHRQVIETSYKQALGNADPPSFCPVTAAIVARDYISSLDGRILHVDLQKPIVDFTAYEAEAGVGAAAAAIEATLRRMNGGVCWRVMPAFR
jgi:hypothetical protein